MRRDHFLIKSICFCIIAFFSVHNSAQAEEAKTGSAAARKYFVERKKEKEREGIRSVASADAPRYMSVAFSFFVDEDTYKWGKSKKDDVGQGALDITYRLGEWQNSMDLSIRADFTTYKVDAFKPFKFSILPMISFPDAKSGFPLYFGAGIGPGIFFKQAEKESSLSLDYQIMAGLRFYNLFGSAGINLEFGMKNMLLLFSDGQHNGTYAALGLVFAF